MKKIYTYETHKKKILNTPQKRKDYKDGMADMKREVEFAEIAHEMSEQILRLCQNGIIPTRIKNKALGAVKRYKDFVK